MTPFSNNFYLRMFAPVFSLILFLNSTTAQGAESPELFNEPEISICSQNKILLGTEKPADFDIQNLQHLCHIIDTYRSQLNSIFSLSNKSTITVQIMSRKSLQTLLCKWCEAVTINGIVYVPASVLNTHDNLKTLHHEIVHAYIYSIAGNRVPAWIEEGLAQIISGQTNEIIQTPAPESFSLRSLRKDFKNPDAEHVLAAYDISVLAVRLLLQSFSFTHFGEYLKKISYG